MKREGGKHTVAEYVLLTLQFSGRRDSIHSQLIYFHAHCLEAVVAMKKKGEPEGKAGEKVGGLDH